MVGREVVVTARSCLVPHTFLTEVGEADIVAGNIVTTRDLQVSLQHRCSLTIELFEPVGVEVLVLVDTFEGLAIAHATVLLNLFLGPQRILPIQIAHTILSQRHVIGVLVLHLISQHLEANLLSEVDLGLTLLTTLGSNEDGTVGTTHTIDSGSSSILQHGDVLNGEGIEEREVTLHIIHDDQRITGTAVHGTDTTDVHLCLCPSRL